MVKIGFLFPGQGAQTVGMGKDYYESFDSAKKIFDSAKDSIGVDVAALCFDGPEELLTKTVNAQVAIFTTSCAISAVLKEQYPTVVPALNAGLSLGEYSALVSAGILDFETALRIVHKRGQLMEAAANNNPGGMVSVIGLDEQSCNAIAAECDVDVANYNSPEQIVLSGLKENIACAHDAAVKAGAKKAVVLNVSGAFHSRLMNDAAVGMQDVLADVAFAAPTSPFVPNVKATPNDDVAVIKEDLISQVAHSVKWTQTIQYAFAQGIVHCLEIGPGKVLKGLARRTQREMNVIALETPEALSAIGELIV